MKLYKKLFILLILLANALWASVTSVRLLSERHRTEWNWVEYRLLLTNLSNLPLVNPTIRYFAENPKIQFCRANPNESSCSGMQLGNYGVDSTLRAVVDYHSVVHSVIPSFYYGSKFTAISLKFHGTIPSQGSSVVHFRIMKENYPAWDCSHDYSYQSNAGVQENYKMAVYDGGGNVLWGYDPVALKHDTVNVYWDDRSGSAIISQYDGSDSAKTFNSRFWLLKGTPMTLKERKLLDSMGVKHLETTRYQNKGLHLFRANEPISKKKLNEILPNFYNAFVVNDSSSFSTEFPSDELYEETQTCDANGSCTTVVSERTVFDMLIECWPDLTMGACKSIVLSCGGDSAYIDRDLILAKIRKDSVQCLEKHRDVKIARVQGKMVLDNYDGRSSINIENLQQSENGWSQALQEKPMSANWLNGTKYTGEGIIVDVHDEPIDFTHPGLNEPDMNGVDQPRKVLGFVEDDRPIRVTKDGKDIVYGHGTHVAGIIGGNGRNSGTFENAEEYQYRGVAPKVKFLSTKYFFTNQRGHVVNVSGSIPEISLGIDENHKFYIDYYGNSSVQLDKSLFYNSKRPSELGDNLTKTFVTSAGNFGDRREDEVCLSTTECEQMTTATGYHSISSSMKNPIVVGSYNQSNYVLSAFSSLGPTWDGRIKPDVMAPGDGPKYRRKYDGVGSSKTPIEKGINVGNSEWRSGIISAIPEENGIFYGPKNGTSQASPFVAGVVALMYQKFKEKTGLPLDYLSMRNSTTKALLIHTAIDMKDRTCTNYVLDDDDYDDDYDFFNIDIKNWTPYGVGPDFATGWGRVDAEAALGMIENFDAGSKTFDKFREFHIYQGTQKRWTINVPNGNPHLRVTLAWDDAPGDPDVKNYMKSKLVNDLDVYLIDPKGFIWYPWILEPLPTDNVDRYGKVSKANDIYERKSGLENISLADAVNSQAKRNYNSISHGSCLSPVPLDDCFDRLNNVEVVDVFDADPGEWQVVVKGYRVEQGNSPDGGAQVASIVSSFPLNEPTSNKNHPYAANKQITEIVDLAKYCNHSEGCLEYYVTFGPETSLGNGDHIYLYDVWDHLIGDYTGNSLANQRINVKTRFLKIVLDSNNDDSQGWGYSISGVEGVSYGVLQVLFPPYKKVD